MHNEFHLVLIMMEASSSSRA